MGATENPSMEEVRTSQRGSGQAAHGQHREQLYMVATAEVFLSPGWKTLWQTSSQKLLTSFK